MIETFFTLLRDPGHWFFELFLMVLFDGLVGAVAWPMVKRHIHRDIRRSTTSGSFTEEGD